MSRALRRHPVAQPKQGQRQRPVRPTAPKPSPGGGKAQPRTGRGIGGFFRPHWLMEIISELRKVTWPSAEDTRYLTFVVLVVSIAAGLFLGGVDLFFNWLIDNTLLRS
jgi:preprotein translocase SecE subunit